MLFTRIRHRIPVAFRCLAAVLGLVASHPARADPLPSSYNELVLRLLPGVVNISTFKPVDPSTSAGATRKASLGSGFVIDPAGIIVTNRHVVEGAAEISVTLHDNSSLPAKLIGWGARTDIALLQVTPKRPLPALAFGDSEKVVQGDHVIAIGNPLGFGSTVTSGIVSARSRDIKTSRFDSYIQTDASINPGNSGGPLFNLAGDVVGITTALYTLNGEGGSIGLGFAIPAFDAQFVIGRLRQYGRVRAGWLGLQSQAMSEDLASATGLPPDASSSPGVIVTGLQQGGAALAAGLQMGDVVLKAGDQAIETPRGLDRAIGPTPIGTVVPLIVWRPGGLQTIPVTVAEDPEEVARSRLPVVPVAAIVNSPAEAGLAVSPVTADLRARFRLAGDQQGLLVTRVERGSVGSSIGMLVGDVIVSVDRHPVRSVRQLQDAWTQARRAGKSHVLLLIQGVNGTRWIGSPA